MTWVNITTFLMYSRPRFQTANRHFFAIVINFQYTKTWSGLLARTWRNTILQMKIKPNTLSSSQHGETHNPVLWNDHPLHWNIDKQRQHLPWLFIHTTWSWRIWKVKQTYKISKVNFMLYSTKSNYGQLVSTWSNQPVKLNYNTFPR